jgi:DNA-binding XRE family transcriptional regulator
MHPSPTNTDIDAGAFLDPIEGDRLAWQRMPAQPPNRMINKARRASSTMQRAPNNVQRLREEQLLTKAELARKAGISPLTVSRIESGLECRMDTKRKIIIALGLTPSDRRKVFGRGAGGRIS